jgi:hypothetical protein
VHVICIIDTDNPSFELQRYVWSGSERMVCAFTKIHYSKVSMGFGVFFRIAAPEKVSWREG